MPSNLPAAVCVSRRLLAGIASGAYQWEKSVYSPADGLRRRPPTLPANVSSTSAVVTNDMSMDGFVSAFQACCVDRGRIPRPTRRYATRHATWPGLSWGCSFRATGKRSVEKNLARADQPARTSTWPGLRGRGGELLMRTSQARAVRKRNKRFPRNKFFAMRLPYGCALFG